MALARIKNQLEEQLKEELKRKNARIRKVLSLICSLKELLYFSQCRQAELAAWVAQDGSAYAACLSNFSKGLHDLFLGKELPGSNDSASLEDGFLVAGIQRFEKDDGPELTLQEVEFAANIHCFQKALISMVQEEDGDEDDDEAMISLLVGNDDLTYFLLGGAVLLPVQKAFKAYALQHGLIGQSDPFHGALEKLDELAIYIQKKAAFKQHEKTRVLHIHTQKLRFFEQEEAQNKSYQHALMLCDQKDYVFALSLFLQGARHFHVPCLTQAGKMFLNGIGCSQSFELAFNFLQMAYVLETRRENCMSLLVLSVKAHQDQQCRQSCPEPDKITCDAWKVWDAISDFKRHILFRKDQPAKRFFYLGEFYAALYMSQELGKDEQPVANSFLQNACRYFEAAFDFSFQAFEREFVLLVEPTAAKEKEPRTLKKEIAEEQGLILMGRNKEPLDITCWETTKQLGKLKKEIAEQLTQLYLYAGESEELAPVEKLCNMMGIEMPDALKVHPFL